MTSLRNALLEHVAAPLLVLVLTPSALLLGSELATGDWRTWLREVPVAVRILVGLVFVVWIWAAIIRQRVVRQGQRDLPGVQVSRGYPREVYGHISHAGVLWRILIPAHTPQLYPSRAPALDIERVEVDTPPLCPKCETELEEVDRYFGGYFWTCDRCGRRTKSKESYFREAERAERISKSLVRERLRHAK